MLAFLIVITKASCKTLSLRATGKYPLLSKNFNQTGEERRICAGKGTAINSKDNKDVTSSMCDLSMWHLKAVKYLVGNGANVNAKKLR